MNAYMTARLFFRPFLVLGVTLAVFTTGVAQAQSSKEDRGREALRRAQQMIAKLQQEKADLEREKSETAAKLTAATADLDKLKKTNAESQKRLVTVERQAGAAGQESKTLREKLDTTDKRVSELTTDKHNLEKTAEENQKRWQAEQQALQGKLTAEEEYGQICTKKNQQLARVTSELMARYQKKGVWAALVNAEPLTGLSSVETENLLQDYSDRVEENKIDKADKAAK
jgi:chromosome segregation ATPase